MSSAKGKLTHRDLPVLSVTLDISLSKAMVLSSMLLSTNSRFMTMYPTGFTTFVPGFPIVQSAISKNVPCITDRTISCSSQHSEPRPPRQTRRAFLAAGAAVTALSVMFPQQANARNKKSHPNLVLPENIVQTDDTPTSPTDAPSVLSGKNGEENQILGYQTQSGITFVEFDVGKGRKPKWGDLVNIHYSLFTLAPSKTELIEHESTFNSQKDGYLIHHGNGEHILGLEEMIHSMRTGSKRRAIFPRALAYTRSGMSPVPYGARARQKFLNTLNSGDGTVVMDIELRWIAVDSGDRGYFTDLTPTDEELIELLKGLREENPEPGVLSITI